MDLAVRAGDRKLDSSYRSAFYLLSHDSELAKAAGKHISEIGIDFPAMKRAVRGLEETTRQVVDIAHNLFTWKSKCKVSPFEISRLGDPYLVVNAMFIAAHEAKLVFERDSNGQIKLSVERSPYRETVKGDQEVIRLHQNMLAEDQAGQTDDELER